jgi:hypothetical protein
MDHPAAMRTIGAATLAAVRELGEYIGEVVRRTEGALRGDLAAIYLHGSSAMGAFVPSRSDVDVLTVTEGPLVSGAKVAVAEALSERSLPCPGVGLELSIVTAESAGTPSDTPAFELHIGTEENIVLDGADHPGDPDLVVHFAMARARGVSLFGPRPAELLAPVDRARLLRTIADDLTWAVEHRFNRSAVLNACRALRFARDGVLCSKPEGGDWALEQGVGDTALIASALQRQSGADEAVDADAAAIYATRVSQELLRSVGAEGLEPPSFAL